MAPAAEPNEGISRQTTNMQNDRPHSVNSRLSRVDQSKVRLPALPRAQRPTSGETEDPVGASASDEDIFEPSAPALPSPNPPADEFGSDDDIFEEPRKSVDRYPLHDAQGKSRDHLRGALAAKSAGHARREKERNRTSDDDANADGENGGDDREMRVRPPVRGRAASAARNSREVRGLKTKQNDVTLEPPKMRELRRKRKKTEESNRSKSDGEALRLRRNPDGSLPSHERKKQKLS